MSTQKVGTVKIPIYSKDNYGMWKKKMLLFLQVANPKYADLLVKGPSTPMIIETEKIVDGIVVTPARMYNKDPKDYTDDEKLDASLDAHLQLILVDCLDTVMHNHVLNCTSAKHIWKTIEIINEGTEEVKKNKLVILRNLYEHFRSNAGEGITEVVERFNKLINDLSLQGKVYPHE